MEYRQSGRSGLRLPVVSLGLWHNFGSDTPLRKQEDIIRHAFDAGITHFDLANNYGPEPGAAEENFGRILAHGLKSRRDEMIVTTKAGHLMWDGPYGEGGSRKHLMASIDQSLRRMGVDYVDIFYSHRFCPDTPLDETAGALADIVRSGKALYIGLSKYPVEEGRQMKALLEARGVRPIVYQDRYNILCRKPEAAHLDFVRHEGLGFVAFSPLAQGLLTDRYLHGIPADSRVNRRGAFLHEADITPERVEMARKLNDIASGRGQTLAEMALSWLLAHDEVTSVITGVSSTAQLDSNIAAANAPAFTPEELAAIDAATEGLRM